MARGPHANPASMELPETPTFSIPVLPLTREAFAPYGEVIETDNREHFPVNDGRAQRFHALAKVDVLQHCGYGLISIFRSQPVEFPWEIRMMERHPMSSQPFIPLIPAPFVVVVAPACDIVTVDGVRAFITNGRQGVNYPRALWHHPLLALHEETDFLVIDRGGEGKNCDEFFFGDSARVVLENFPE